MGYNEIIKREKTRHIIAIPKSFIHYCYENAKSPEHKREMKKLLDNYDKHGIY